ncbi:DMT family transporter [Oceanobacter mangrovi]|uniref:DMT family transporter n=1 Tax=Oceanobacter mangrovi TaxID=2862510 RepID=UPI001C8DEFEC|nr:DMT family transporter [Oceanobacter mangrovi]
MNLTPYQTGLLLVVISTILWSTAGLFVRVADGMEVWLFVVWRSIFTVATMAAYLVLAWWLQRRKQRSSAGTGGNPRLRFGKPELLSSTAIAVASIFYVASLSWTSVANVMTIYATLPFLAGLFAFLWLRERVSRLFIICGLAAMAGVIIAVGGGFSGSDLWGYLAALVMTATFASQLVIARRYQNLNTPFCVLMGGLFSILFALPFVEFSIPSAQGLLGAMLYGAFSTGLAYVLVLAGSRRIGSAEAALISMLDVVLAPVWVWWFYDEHVDIATLVGGSVVLLAVFWYLSGKALAKRPAVLPLE